MNAYHEGLRFYRLKSQKFPNLFAKAFHEKDIPIQVAVGNYDLGICGLDWVEELLVKYPSAALIKLRDLGYGEGKLYAVTSRSGGIPGVGGMKAEQSVIRIASEYPNLAEFLALNLRLRWFSIFPLWGAAEVYPPDSADLALIPGQKDEAALNHDLMPVCSVLGFSAYLIANRNSWEKKDLSQILASIDGKLLTGKPNQPSVGAIRTKQMTETYCPRAIAESTVRLALPDGHQQQPALELLNKAGIRIDDYPSTTGNRRPTSNLDGVMIKVIRPQDMPLQVANGNFDLAITGQDWLREHLYQFPSSPATELLALNFGRVKIVAVTIKDLPVTDVSSLKHFYAENSIPVRVASEYVNIADKYARDNRLGEYKVIPTWGASEAFLPEDADLLIENTQTGRTIDRHNLKIVDTLFQSSACLIGNKNSVSNRNKEKRIKSLINTLRAVVDN